MGRRLGPRWRKVFGDISGNTARSLLVVLAIAVGAASIGTMLGAREAVVGAITAGHQSVTPASASIFGRQIDTDVTEAVRRAPGVGDAQVRGVLTVRLHVAGDIWRDLRLYVLPDEPLRLNLVRPEVGPWPAPTGELLLERSSLAYLRLRLSDRLLIETPTGDRVEMRVAGTAFDLNQPPVTGTGIALGYISPSTLAALGPVSQAGIDQVDILVSERANDEAHVRSVAAGVRRLIEERGGHVLDTYVPEPGKHPSYDGSETMLVLLAVIGAVMVFMAALLVANTIAALLASQVRQVGVMKTLGAGTGQVASMYLGLVLTFGLAAYAIALPVSIVGAWGLALYALSVVNFDAPPPGLSPGVLALMGLAALGVPILAAALPIRAALGMSVREAIASTGTAAGHFGHGWLDRGLRRLGGLPRPMLLSIRNTFRRKARLWLTLATLSLAGGVFIGVLSVRQALLGSVDDEFKYIAYDAQITLAARVPTETVERAARGVGSVVMAEGWVARTAYRVREDQAESGAISLIGPPAETRMIEPVVVAGRWLLPTDADAIVISSDLVQTEPDLQVGGDLVLRIGGRPTTWRVVGVVKTYRFDRSVGPVVYAERGALGRAVGADNSVDTLQVTTRDHDAAGQAAVAARVVSALESAGVQPQATATASARRAIRDDVAGIILTFLVLMAVLLALVGGLGLAGTMSMNVLERTREIGVLRAIGASDRDVVRIVVSEGVAIAAIAWLLGSLLAVPVSRYLNALVGQIFLRQPLPEVFAPASVALWLVLVLVLAVVSTSVPALAAARTTIRHALAYE
jgi:putative ABC transport system permease protein